ncbi:hypothetical protein [Alicyclobacillus sp. SO9]|nr:hypothetical protein [Alicyclobacillus sp. SO9]
MAEAKSKTVVLSHEASRQIIAICLRAIRRRQERDDAEQSTQ